MSQEDIYINGELLRLRREARGWVLNDMATRACMSVKQIRQLEDGGMSSFYSVAVKATAAKKVGALLGLSPEEVFAPVVEPELESVESEAVNAGELIEVQATADAAASATEQTLDAEPVSPAETESPSKPVVVAQAAVDEPKPKTSLWVIGGLFAAALAVAAYLQPQEEPTSEPAPPLQVVPSEDPASAASAADDAASGALEPASMATNVTKPASSPMANTSSPVAAASAVRPIVNASAPAALRSVSAASTPAPTASKTP